MVPVLFVVGFHRLCLAVYFSTPSHLNDGTTGAAMQSPLFFVQASSLPVISVTSGKTAGSPPAVGCFVLAQVLGAPVSVHFSSLLHLYISF